VVLLKHEGVSLSEDKNALQKKNAEKMKPSAVFLPLLPKKGLFNLHQNQTREENFEAVQH